MYVLHVHFLFVYFWDEVRSKEIKRNYRFWPSLFPKISLVLLYFISTRDWVEKLHIKNCSKNLMVVMSSYFYKDNKYKTLWRRPFYLKNTNFLVPFTVVSIGLRSGIRSGIRSGVEWTLTHFKKIKIKFENLKSKFKH